MLFTLLDDKTLYQALLTRDDAFEGRAFVGVKTTGIFCRLTCPAPTKQIRAELGRYFAGESAHFTTPLALNGSEFTRAVWAALQRIPAGETRSYGQIAAQIGQPSAARAVARANGANQIALVIPCHRVIGADGSLTGYGGGMWRKQRLLEIEQQYNHKP